MTFEIYKLEWILSRHTFGNTTSIFDDMPYLKVYFFTNKHICILLGIAKSLRRL